MRSSARRARPRPDRGTCSPRRGRAHGRRRTARGAACRGCRRSARGPPRSIWTVKWLGTTVRPRTSTERLSSISRTMRRPSSTGRRPLRNARANAPSTMRSSRRSNPDRPTGRPYAASPTARPRVARGRDRLPLPTLSLGRVAELADAQDSGSCVRKDVGVQVPPRPPTDRGPRPTDSTCPAGIDLTRAGCSGREPGGVKAVGDALGSRIDATGPAAMSVASSTTNSEDTGCLVVHVRHEPSFVFAMSRG